MLEVHRFKPKNVKLSKYINHYWLLNSTSYSYISHFLIPVTNIDIICYLSSPIEYHFPEDLYKTDKAHILGIRNKTVLIKQEGVFKVLGISLNDLFPRTILKENLYKSKNTVIPLTPEDYFSFLNNIDISIDNIHNILDIFESKLENLFDHSLSVPTKDELIMHNFINKGSDENISKFCSQSGLNQKYLYRLFLKYLGIPPKEYLKIQRIQKTYKALLLNKYEKMSNAAYDYGYFDQPHLIHDLNNILNMSPKTASKSKETIKSILTHNLV